MIGAKIYFSDVDKKTGQMTPQKLEECIKKNKIKNLKVFLRCIMQDLIIMLKIFGN